VEFLESAFYAGVALLAWVKIGSVVLTIALLLFACWRARQVLANAVKENTA
jgi:hypothetical protein